MNSKTPAFYFRERNDRLNWRSIRDLDLNKMLEYGDIHEFEPYLSNLAFSLLEKEDIEIIEDPILLKMFKLSQYALEYLMSCQSFLYEEANALDKYYQLSEDKLAPLEQRVEANNLEISHLKAELKQKKKVVEAYKESLRGPIFKCHLCPKVTCYYSTLIISISNRSTI